MRTTISIAASFALLAVSTVAEAAEVIWLDSDHSAYGGEYSLGTSLVFSGGGVNVKASAWSIHDDGKIYQAKLGVWNGGLGVTNGSGDNSHTIDNSGFADFVILQFDQLVELDKLRLTTGWHGMNDTDATLGYATTAVPYNGSLAGMNGQPASLLAGLNLYGDGSWGNSGNSYRAINADSNISNLWLIGASFNNPEGARKLDGYKLEKVTFFVPPPPPPAVPEPSAWAMLLLGFGAVAGAMRSRRRRELTVSYT